MRSKFSVLLMIVLTTLLLIGCSTEINPVTDKTISLNAIVGITAPVSGAAPVTTLDSSQYTGTISWNPEVNETFAASTVYTASITLTPKPGFTLSGVPANGFAVIGATATNAAGSGIITAVFPSTAETTVNLTAIPGVIAPVTGAAPVTTLDASQYTGTINWNPEVSETFAVGIAYTATITLTPKPGFTLSGVPANGFAVTGATATNAAGSGIITAVFPSTAETTVNLTAIPGVIAPVTGAAPVTTLDASQYTGTISWNPMITDNFMETTIYTATITLTPKVGFTLSGVAANSFTVSGATATNAAGSGVVSAVFPKTSICNLIYVPAGRFQRDDTSTNISAVSAFWMSECEITRSQFKKIMGGNDPTGTSHSGGEEAPVQIVTWYMAIAFCNKLSIAEGLDPVYAVSGVDFNELFYADVPTKSNDTWNRVSVNWDNNGYRLPTDMEWKWAAMGAPATGQNGLTNTMARFKAYAGSEEGSGTNNIGNYAWYVNNSGNFTHPVGQKDPNELGFYDMAGNVAEWCWDVYTPDYPTGLLEDYRGGTYQNSKSSRVKNGGALSDTAIYCQIMHRSATFPEEKWVGSGLRVVRK